MVLDHVLAHEADTAFPSSRGVIEYVVNGELVLVLLCEVIQLGLEQDVFNIDVGVDERDLGLVQGIFHDGANDLEHGSNASAACNHTKVARQGCVVVELSLGSTDTDFLTN